MLLNLEWIQIMVEEIQAVVLPMVEIITTIIITMAHRMVHLMAVIIVMRVERKQKLRCEIDLKVECTA